MKTFIVIVLLFVIFSLGQAMFYLVRDKGKSNNTVRFLTVRIAVSFALFLFIILALKMGWIQAHSIVPR